MADSDGAGLMGATRRLCVAATAEALHRGIDAIKREQDLPLQFPPEVEAAAARAAETPRWPALDRTDIPFVTVDPPGAMDLDQALHVERRGDGYRVHYAIADVAAFVTAGDAIDREAHRRGETLYGADAKVPLHPRALSEGVASLLPDQKRPALLWTMDLDATGEGTTVDVRRARVRSRVRFDYATLQAQIDAGKADPMWDALREIGTLRKQRERLRGGISLPLPEQEMDERAGRWTLAYRARHAVEDWNEQISLLTGMAAAHLMLRGGVGLLRTLPAPQDWMIDRLRRTARALKIEWPAGMAYPDFIRSLDPADPVHIAMMVACTSLLRGAAYVAFDGSVPADAAHWALASEYTHVTAPLRRLVDRYTGEICVALCARETVPDWVLQALPGLPATMQASGQRAGRFERAVIDLAEALALAPMVGDTFEGSIVEVDRKDPMRGTAMLQDLAIEGPVVADEPLQAGSALCLQLLEADPQQRKIRFAPV
jgi:exoribonuclease R